MHDFSQIPGFRRRIDPLNMTYDTNAGDTTALTVYTGSVTLKSIAVRRMSGGIGTLTSISVSSETGGNKRTLIDAVLGAAGNFANEGDNVSVECEEPLESGDTIVVTTAGGGGDNIDMDLYGSYEMNDPGAYIST